jgi:RHS repeat-associated protein
MPTTMGQSPKRILNKKTITTPSAFLSPFGGAGGGLEGNWNGAAGPNKYQYNGKEWNDDFGLGWNLYEARPYDPATGRFTEIDLLADVYNTQTPYAYASNSPVTFIDFMGMGTDENEKNKCKEFGNCGGNSGGAGNLGIYTLSQESVDRLRKEADEKSSRSSLGSNSAETCPTCPSSKEYDDYRNSKDYFDYEPSEGKAKYASVGGEVTAERGAAEANQTGFRAPDFYSLNIGIPTPFFVSGSLTFTMDRHFQWYISPGVSVGVPSGRSFSLTASWLTQSRKPTPTQTYNFLSGLGMGMSGGYFGVGGVWNGSPSNLKSNNTANAFGFGIMTPQFGLGYSYTPEFLIFNRK